MVYFIMKKSSFEGRKKEIGNERRGRDERKEKGKEEEKINVWSEGRKERREGRKQERQAGRKVPFGKRRI